MTIAQEKRGLPKSVLKGVRRVVATGGFMWRAIKTLQNGTSGKEFQGANSSRVREEREFCC
jgi:hypothetical protein